MDEWGRWRTDRQLPIHERHVHGKIHQPFIINDLFQCPAERLGGNMLVTFPLVDQQAITQVRPIVINLFHTMHNRPAGIFRRNPAPFLAIQAVQVILTVICWLQQVQQQMLIDPGNKRRAVYMPLLPVLVHFNHSPVGYKPFPRAINQGSMKHGATIPEVLDKLSDLPFTGVTLKGSPCRFLYVLLAQI